MGRYGVDVAGFETFLEGLELTAPLLFIDEIGKMECLSPRFVTLMRELLACGRTVVATVALHGGGFIAEVKERPDCELMAIDAGSRERMLGVLAGRLRPGFCRPQ